MLMPTLRLQLESAAEGSDSHYNVDQFVQDAVELKITPFMLDTYAHEYEEIVRIRDAHANEVAALQHHNRALQAQTWAEQSICSMLSLDNSFAFVVQEKP
jgi:hypothetical protein